MLNIYIQGGFMKLKKMLVWMLCGSATFVLAACYGGPVRVDPENRQIKINNNTIKGLNYEAFIENNKLLP